MEIVLVLHNLRSTYNVGAILRTAEGLGVEKVICSGYTPSFQNPNNLPFIAAKIERQIGKTALGAERLVPMRYCDQIENCLKELRDDGYQIIGLENHLKHEKPLYTLGSPNLLNRLKNHIVLVLGEEVEGIAGGLYPSVDFFVEIPMVGKKESFNVSVAAAIAVYALKTAM